MTEIDYTLLETGVVAEMIVRVNRYADDMQTPASFQAIAKRRDAPTGPWGLGIRGSPTAAVKAALDEALRQYQPAPTTPANPYGF